MSLSEKAKTYEVPMQQCISCGEIIPDTHEDAVTHSRAKHDVITNFRPIKVSMILFSDYQQEIDKYKTYRDNACKKWCDLETKGEGLERERGLQKQKLQSLLSSVPHHTFYSCSDIVILKDYRDWCEKVEKVFKELLK